MSPYQTPFSPGNPSMPYQPGAFPGFDAPGRDRITQALMNSGPNMPVQPALSGGQIPQPTIGMDAGTGTDTGNGLPPMGAGMVAQPTIGMGGPQAPQPPGMGGGAAASANQGPAPAAQQQQWVTPNFAATSSMMGG